MDGRGAVNAGSQLIKDNFVAVAASQFHATTADGAKGKFFKSLKVTDANQYFVATPSGKWSTRLALSGVNGDNIGELKRALQEWQKLPEAERKPGTIELEAGAEKAADTPRPPAGGLILKVYQRNMKRDGNGALARITREDLQDKKAFPDEPWRWANGLLTEPMPDVMWLTAAEWKSLVPADPKKGNEAAVSDAIQKRLFRYYLSNGTFGLRHVWSLKDIRSGGLTLTVEDVSPVLRLRVQGKILLATDADPAKADHGYDARLDGLLTYDPQKESFTGFDIIAVGDWWGGDWEGGRFARPGRTPLGVAFELASGDKADELVPPLGYNNIRGVLQQYFAAEKP